MILASIGDWFSANEATWQSGIVYAILGLSLYISLRAGFFSLAGVGAWGAGAYTAGRLVLDGRLTVVALAAAIAVGALIGFMLSLVLGRLRELYLVMATFAFVLLVSLVAREWEDVTGGALGLLGIPLTVNTLWLLVALGVAIVIVVLTERGSLGRTLAAVRTDVALAETAGIAVVPQRMIAFTLSSAMGALSGALQVMLFSTMAPDQVSFPLVVDALTIVVIGGTAAWYGPVLGGLIIVWLPELLRFTGEWRSLVQGLIMVAIVVYAPGGAVGLAQRTRALIATARRRSSAPPGSPAMGGRTRE